ASAHPTLVRSEPADAVVLWDAPPAVRLVFSEPISVQLSSVQLLDVHGTPVPGMNVFNDLGPRGVLTAELPRLASGTYDIAWRVLSDSDGHVTQGHIVFGV